MKKYGKLAVDTAMSLLLLLLMAYELIGAAVHEWLGIAMFLLVKSETKDNTAAAVLSLC